MRARSVLAATTALTPDAVALVQRAVRQALAGKYVVEKVEGAHAQPDAAREDEYVFDEQGRVRFQRYTEPDRARPGNRLATILEFTELPAVKCQDRAAVPNRRLGMTFHEDGKSWRLGNPMVVDATGAPWAAGSPGFSLLNTPRERFEDAGTLTIDGRRARGLRHAAEGGERTIWIDIQSLVPVLERTTIALGDKRAEVSSRYRYPAARAIGRPLALPDCI